MSIVGIQPGLGTHEACFEHGAGGRRTTGVAEGGTDTATVFADIQERAATMQRQTDAASTDGSGASSARAGAAEEVYPLEAYRIPNWYADLSGGYTVLTPRIGASWEESRTEYDRLGSGDQALYQEYAGILRDYYHQERAAAGVPVSSDIGDYYHNFLQNEATQEAVRQGLVKRLADDPRAMELMRYFNIES